MPVSSSAWANSTSRSSRNRKKGSAICCATITPGTTNSTKHVRDRDRERRMQPFSLIRDHIPAVSSVEEVFALVAEAIPDLAAAGDWSLDAAGEAAAARELARSNPDALVVLVHALTQRFTNMRRWPRTQARDIPSAKRIVAD